MSLHVEYGLGFKQQYRPKLVQWVKPPLGCLKLNIDGCFKGSLATDGGVLRNANGDVVFAFHEFYDESCSNILEAELRALLIGYLKLNTDGCFRGSLDVDGGVLRNSNGDAVFAHHEFYDESCSNILEAKLHALLPGLKLCFENGYLFKFNTWAEFDSIVGARCVDGRTDKSLSVEFLHILDEIKFLYRRFQVGLI
ncbi:Hypothetical predicted protein [Olea europaea subsp. europaea]|uniref:RNase H type-1 domain-containing protein n=1 Tax=Olea europaea subsp. europaea TaxID=158383 RepID=A0A8S0UFF9_OLEEU|nr:Hypothetical predicted protein [Olea europaea subsp. europaea]